MHKPTRKHRKPSTKVTKMLFIRYPEHYKEYVMYRNIKMVTRQKLDPTMLIFLGMSSQALVKLKRVLNCMSYNMIFKPSPDEEEI